MADDQWDVNVLLVRERALAVKAMCARHLAMICREDDDGPVGQPERVEFAKEIRDLEVHGPNRVDVDVVEPAPAVFLKGVVTDHVIPDLEELSVRPRPPWRVHRFAQGWGNRQVPSGFVELVIGGDGRV